jgi:signal peptidase I
MTVPAQHTTKPRIAQIVRLGRYCLCGAVLSVCALVLIETLVLEPFHIPTGSMAPALRGHHRVATCPCCGHEVVVGRAGADANGSGHPHYYRKAFCQNCGLFPISLGKSSEIPGDKILVNRTAFLLRAPSRWEIVVFRLLDAFYIKRLLGLPGEEILIHDGDVYVDGELLRKTFAEAKRMALLIFDQMHPSADRWEFPSIPTASVERGAAQTLAGRSGSEPFVQIDGLASPSTATYRNYLAAAKKCEAIRDEYAYNGGVHADSECVHDFLIDTQIEVAAGAGTVSLRLCDGSDWVEVLLPVGARRAVEAFAWPMAEPGQTRKLAESEDAFALRGGQRCRVELAFVDRRLSLAVDGKLRLSADLPVVKQRGGVERPFQAQADGVRLSLHSFRLYRDVHYGQQGTNGVHGKSARLGVDQFFLLGDNSPNSEDSRFWPNQGRVDAASLIGSALIVHGSNQDRAGMRWLP